MEVAFGVWVSFGLTLRVQGVEFMVAFGAWYRVPGLKSMS